MATQTTGGGSTTSFSNTPQAKDDIFTSGVTAAGAFISLTEDNIQPVFFDVMGNDLGGNAKTLFSIDNGINNSGAMSGYSAADLLTQDTARAEATSGDTSLNGAKIWITADGKVGYDASALSAQIGALSAGDFFTDSFIYAIRLGNGTLSWATATVKIAGVNDGPVAVADSNAVKEDTAPNPVGGNVLTNDTDVDVQDTHTVTAVNGSAGNVAHDVVGTYGTLHLNADGSYTYTLNNAQANVQALAEGQQVTDVFSYTNSDNHGGSSSSSLTIKIAGTNDGPTITSGVQSGAVVEDAPATPDPSDSLNAAGTISFNDVDLSDGHTATFAAAPGNTTALGTFSLDPVSEAANAANGSVQWHYALNNAAAQYLAQGQSVTESYVVTVNDGHGGTVTQTVTVTINGTNDAPVITSAAQAGTVKEDTTLTATGTVTSSDVDHGATAAYSGAATGTYGSFAIDAATGVWTYTLDNAGHQDLAEGESHTETFTVTVTDDKGATATQDVLITINGTNDAPVITSAAQAGTVKEDTTLTATGTVTSSDVDHGATAAYSGAATGTYGSFAIDAATGVWTYTLDNAGHQDLAEGESHTETFTVTVTDDKGATATQDVLITINGTNDAPVITATATGSVTEDTPVGATETTSGTISFADVDLTDTHTVSATFVSSTNAGGVQLGSLSASKTLDTSNGSGGTGSWNYSVNNSSIQFLAANQTIQETYQVKVDDGHGGTATQNVVVTITGSNDAPVVTSSAQTGAITELANTHASTTADTASGAVTFTDADRSDTHTVTVTGVTASGTTSNGSGALPVNATILSWLSLGGLTDSTNGATGSKSWTFSAQDQNFDYLFGGQTVTLTYAVQVADTHGGTTSQNVAVTITGTDEPSNTLINTVVQGHQGSNNDPSTVTITFASGATYHTDFTNLSDVMHVSGPPNVAVINGSGSFIDATHYTFSVDKGAGSNNGSTYNLVIDAGAFSDSAGHTNIATTKNGLKPAGISGSPVNLGLTDLSGNHAEVTLTIAGAPSGWTVNGTTHNSDGSWTVVTNDVGSLSLTTAANYTGALVLNVAETWINANGSMGTATVVDNVEAYAPGSPIFAWSGNDHLTGSSGHDLFVFSQPIGKDVVHSFEVSSDVIDLISYTWQSFADVQAHTADDASGNAVITLADGQTITLDGVHAADLTAANVEFDVTPTVENPGAMTIGDGAMLPLSGVIHNSGEIDLQASGDDTLLQLIQTGITLNGGGHVVLSDDDHNFIAGTASNVTFDNVDNVISGAGQLGQGSLTLSNEGTVDASGTHALVIDTGTNVITNAGTLEATGSGGLMIDSAIANSGLLWANGGTVTALAEVTGSGTAEISGTGTMEFGAASSANVTFDANATGHLILDDAFHFTGAVSGLAAGNDIDLKGIAFGADTTLSFTENQAGTGGTLTVSDGAHTANVVLLGQYDPTGFNDKADATNGTAISYDPHHMA
ncbi:VCBS domain-containing protein [Bradyrhizobium sp. 143]|uniref:beta strand repeat-containing protein n=1 Tax=Bradyrhizobium sp. 143 TaxID=2782619 RepID=UPI001FFADECA|nr:VCBS domain-containing protein [Bradyrhizobium sp. 143]MCK1711246.1 VCBS domain-containing protein [Bradyrhizobium sp. 143]